ncbi:MAG: ATP-binding cassette domain-containing protein [Chloroflexi bacterium]|jgi:ABC-2 type transport system ATP-binding protein|nr:ATP-binding cassette domain-containing protein [Chloroflexota bacterium]MBT3668762.1 ATP-binding cassette domain-containing protein [Chloroflexota bacterium]MBT4001892.1 ATP-binding cassette domain-containing protein [Chloroflexota bacterium]MBT4305463.1 ATP-binding cassette domain-containing protein [Chloroflexota bacterium]MBT4533074.1 ATP-binding cassette domain-containing protein [Chloroflexota bacterium]
MASIIAVKKLDKHFKVRKFHRGRFSGFQNFFTREHHLVRAVDGVNFEIQSGELIGYLGPNGAGKSTTLKMLTGLLVPTGGEINVDGFVPSKQRKEYVSRIGAVFGQRSTLWWDLPVFESFELLRHIYKIPEKLFKKNLDEFRELLELDTFINTPVRSLSLGQRMRADICAALLHDPKILFLDEPTIGLDVVAKERIRQFIQHINQDRGTTVILTTHDLSDVEKLCNRILIIDEGKLLYDGQLEQLRQKFGGKRQLVVDFFENYPEATIEGAEIVEINGARITFEFERDSIAASDLIGRLSSKYRIRDLEVKEPEIEETIRRIYEQQLLK